MQESPLIGICDGPIEKKGGTFYYTNKIGGNPDLISGLPDEYNQCALCDGVLGHVVQIYCPLAASPYHRTINVFACTNLQCNGKPESWKALRSQFLESEMKQPAESQGTDSLQAKQPAMSTTDWCDEADDWGMEAEDNKPENRSQASTDTAQPETDSITAGPDVSSRLQGLCLNGPGDREGAVPPTAMPTFQPFYISVVEETDLVGHNDLEHANRLLREYEEREGVAVGDIGSCEGEGGEEKYEKSEAKHGDAVFSSFMKESHSVQNKSFELALEFGTILIYTCRDSCRTSGSNTPVEEFLFV